MKRLYVLISKDLDPVYGCVQGGHAVAQYLLENSDWNNEYLIYLYADIEKWKWKLEQMGKKFSIFNEPDLGYKSTALAIVNDGQLFKNLRVVK